MHVTAAVWPCRVCFNWSCVRARSLGPECFISHTHTTWGGGGEGWRGGGEGWKGGGWRVEGVRNS